MKKVMFLILAALTLVLLSCEDDDENSGSDSLFGQLNYRTESSEAGKLSALKLNVSALQNENVKYIIWFGFDIGEIDTEGTFTQTSSTVRAVVVNSSQVYASGEGYYSYLLDENGYITMYEDSVTARIFLAEYRILTKSETSSWIESPKYYLNGEEMDKLIYGGVTSRIIFEE